MGRLMKAAPVRFAVALGAAMLVLAIGSGQAPVQAAAPAAAALAGAKIAAPAASAPKVTVEVLQAGTGGFPPAGSYVLISYKGMLKDGTVFDQAEGVPMPLDEVVPGFAQGLQQMQRGGRYKMTIPPELGYGDQASGPIPANSTLIFEVDLIDFKTAEEMAEFMRQYTAEYQASQAEAGAVDQAQVAGQPSQTSR